jgi:hypothetical protein
MVGNAMTTYKRGEWIGVEINDLHFPVVESGTWPSGQHVPHAATCDGSQQEPPATGTSLPLQTGAHPSGGIAFPASGPLLQTQVELTGPVLLDGGDDPAGHAQMNMHSPMALAGLPSGHVPPPPGLLSSCGS